MRRSLIPSFFRPKTSPLHKWLLAIVASLTLLAAIAEDIRSYWHEDGVFIRRVQFVGYDPSYGEEFDEKDQGIYDKHYSVLFFLRGRATVQVLHERRKFSDPPKPDHGFVSFVADDELINHEKSAIEHWEPKSLLGFGYASANLSSMLFHKQLTISTFFLPLWFPISILALFTAELWRRVSKPYRRRRAGLCPRCGYDLRATPDRCPECGA